MRRAVLGIVIPVFNRWAQTARCLAAIRSSLFQDLTVYVVDHGSEDDTKGRLEADFPEVIRVSGDASWWWSAATNAGIRRALADGVSWVMWLNNDCVVRPDMIGRILEHSRRTPWTMVAPVQMSMSSGKVECYRVRTALTLGFPTTRDPWPLPRRRPRLQPVRLILGGRGVVIPSAAFAAVGFIDEDRLPHYAADHDFYLAARRAGWSLAIAEDALVDVDDATTTLADRAWELNFRDFVRTLRERRSHRNLYDLRAFFDKNYPIPGFAGVGVALNVSRYVGLYAIRRALFLMRGIAHG